MEIRKVQVTGGSSYIITLPKEWVQSQRIAKNEPLGLIVQSDGNLLVTRNIKERTMQSTRTIDVTDVKDPTYLFRLLVGTYIAGFTTIEVRSNVRLRPSISMVIRNFTQMMIGPEVLQETENSIVLKDLLNPSEMPVENILKRMSVIVSNMYMDAMLATGSRNAELLDEILSRDQDVDRLHWLAARQTNIVLKNPDMGRRMGTSPPGILYSLIISRIVERIGDHAVRWAENAKRIVDEEVDPRILVQMKTANELAMGIFKRSINSYFQQELHELHQNIEQIPRLKELCDRIMQLSMDQRPEIAVPIAYIAESIRRSGEYSADIAETAMNCILNTRVE